MAVPPVPAPAASAPPVAADVGPAAPAAGVPVGGEAPRCPAALGAERLGLLEAVFREAPSFLHVLRGPDFVFEFANEAYYQLVGRRDLIGRPAFAALPEAAGGGFPERLAAVLATGVPFVGRELPVTLARTPGAPPEERLIDLVYQRLPDAADGEGRVLGHGVDVTEQVRARHAAEALLAASEARFRAVEDASPDGSVLMRPVFGAAADGAVDGAAGEGGAARAITDFAFVYANPATARLLGAGAEGLVGRTLCECYPDSWANGYLAGYARAFEAGVPFVIEEDHARFGTPVHLHLTAVRAGDLVHARFADVSAAVEARRERERLLAAERAARADAEAERQRLAAVVAHLPVGVTFADAPAGRHAVSNPAAVAIWGLRPASPEVAAYSRDFVGYWPGPGARGSAEEAARRIASHEWPLARALGRGEVVADELAEIERPDGTRRLVSLSAAPVRDGGGAVAGALVTTVDVTEREATLRALEAARQAAEAASRAKSEFLATMSHELRTPLNAIGGYAELIELGIRGPVTAEQRVDLEKIQRAQRHLLGLINGVLNYARVEAGAVHYAPEDFGLNEVLATCEALVAPQVRARGLTLAYAAAPAAGAELRVRADREKVQQVVLNLLSNAVKFTAPGGRLTLGAHVEGPAAASDGGGRVLVRVSDTGIGIAADQLARVFEPFVQVDAALTRTREGTGLGLAISRDLARGMGGDLTVESTPGAGSTFTLTLPAA